MQRLLAPKEKLPHMLLFYNLTAEKNRLAQNRLAQSFLLVSFFSHFPDMRNVIERSAAAATSRAADEIYLVT